MAFDPQELVTLTNHGPMRLRSAVARAMTLPFNERKRATIVREGKPAILRYERIKNLAAEWAAERPVRVRSASRRLLNKNQARC
jgi:hypothetical protein